MTTKLSNRLRRALGGFVGLVALAGMGPALPIAAGVLTTPTPVVAQEGSGQDALVFKNGRRIEGKILDETPTTITIQFMTAGISGTSTFQKSEIISITRGTGAAAAPETPAAVKDPVKPAPRTAAPSSNDPSKKKVYIIELSGEFGKDISQTPIRNAVRDAKKFEPDYLIFVMDNDWSRSGGLEEIKDDEGAFDQLFRAEDIAPILNDEIPREWERQPTVVFWVKKAMGGAAFLPFNCRNIYFHSEGKMGGIGGLTRIFGNMGDLVVREKQFSLRLGHAEGMAIQGGYDPRLILAMARDEYVLSYRLEGGKPVYLERMPQSPDEFLLTDDGDEQGGRRDDIVALARGEGNDCLTLTSKVAFELGVSKGTVDSMDDLIFKLGIARNHEIIPGNSKRIMKGWSDGLVDARRKLARLWRDFNEVQVAAPGGYQQRTQARGRQRAICDEMQTLLKRYEEALDAREVPCPDWATLNIIKERLKTEQMADRPDRR